MKFSFIHAADIHLGREFSDTSMYSANDEIKKYYETGVERVLKNIVNLAIDKEVDFVLIAGDTFDSEDQDFKSKLILKEELKKLDDNNIKVILVCGNHDPSKSYNEITFDFDKNSNVKIVGLNTDICTDEKIYKDNTPVAIIHALSFEAEKFNENPVKKLKGSSLNDKKIFNIGLLHCDLNGSKESNYAPCTESDLKELNYDYWALGHIHLPNDKSDDNIFYSGTCQGRNIKEYGAHGVRYVEVENNNIVLNSFIPVDVIRYEILEIDLSEVRDETEIPELIEKEIGIRNFDDNVVYLLKIIFTGCTEIYSKLEEEIYSDIADSISSSKRQVIEIRNNAQPAVDNKILSEDRGIVGEIYKTITQNSGVCEITLNDIIEKKYEEMVNNCFFTDDELKEFKDEIMGYSKQRCIDICNKVYNAQKQEENHE